MPTLSRRLLWPLAILLLVLGRPLAAADLYYLGQRIPDIQKPWDSHDYQVLIDALKKIEETQKNALPRRSGEFTGPLYLRMVSEENFRPQLNIYSPLEIRQNEAREVLFKLKELMRLYFDFRAAKQPYGAEALGLDWTCDIGSARARVGERVALQGNMDPSVLYANPAAIRAEVARILAAYGKGTGHVFNLGHGITPEVDPAHAGAFFEAVHELSAQYHG